jgi:hypothetical protein
MALPFWLDVLKKGGRIFRWTALRLLLRTDASGLVGGEMWQQFWQDAVRNLGPVYFLLGVGFVVTTIIRKQLEAKGKHGQRTC